MILIGIFIIIIKILLKIFLMLQRANAYAKGYEDEKSNAGLSFRE